MNLPKSLFQGPLRPGASESDILRLESDLNVRLPDDYRDFLRSSNGTEGFLAPDIYVLLWSANQIISLNTGYCVHEFLPGTVLLGSNGADTGYGLNFGASPEYYFAVPLIGMAVDSMSFLGVSFEQFLNALQAATKTFSKKD